MELEGQVAIITGAGRGIGRATALELARMGSDIVVAELDRENAERTAAEVRALGCRALVVPTDVTSRKDLGAMVEQTRAEFGRIDTLAKPSSATIASGQRASPPTSRMAAHWRRRRRWRTMHRRARRSSTIAGGTRSASMPVSS